MKPIDVFLQSLLAGRRRGAVLGCILSLVGVAPAVFGQDGTPVPPTRLSNISVRHSIAPGEILIVGFVIQSGSNTSPTPKPTPMLLRGVGPALGAFGITDAISNPSIRLVATGSNNTTVGQNDDWGSPTLGASSASAVGGTIAAVGAFPLPTTSSDAAMTTTLSAGSYTLLVTGGSPADAGTVLAEAYDAGNLDDYAKVQLKNLSVRGKISDGPGLIGGIAISGIVPRWFLVRVAGPALKNFGITDPISDPKFEIVKVSNNAVIATNDNWSEDGLESTAQTYSAARRLSAFAFADGSKDAAKVVLLYPGLYTVRATGVNGATGTGLLEIYDFSDLDVTW